MTLATEYRDAFSITRPDLDDTPTVRNAVRDWNKGRDFLFEFAVKASVIVGRRDGGTKELAKLIKREVDTVERYAAAGLLWTDMLREYPADSETLRDYLDISFWSAVGVKYKAGLLPLEKAVEFMNEATRQKMTVEKARTMLPSVRVGDSPFKRALRKIHDVIEKDIIEAPALESGMNDKEYRQFIRMAKWMREFLKARLA